MKRLYIITGANGHLGGTIIRCLRGADCQIRGLILPSEAGESDEQLRYYRGDVTDPASLEALFAGTEGFEVVVIHTVAIISIGDAVTSQLYAVNVQGTRNILALCLRHGVKRLVYVSSVHAIPEAEGGAVIREVAAFSGDRVVGAYAKTKAEATQAVLDAARAGLDAVVVHPSGILGPYDEGNNHMVQLIKLYLRGKLPVGVTGGYDFVDVRDVAEGCLSAVDRGRTGECYILSNRYCTIRELLECARGAIGGRRIGCISIKAAKAFAPIFAAFARMTRTRPLFTKYALYTLESNGNFSHEKATAALGFHPRDIRVTVADTIKWLRRAAPVRRRRPATARS